jgi:hypothetical protein
MNFQVLNRYPSQVKYILLVTVKANAISLQAWTGPEVVFRRLRLPDFKTIGT